MNDFILDREPLPPAADRSLVQRYIALYDALDELPYITVLPRGIFALHAAKLWAAARGLETTTVDGTLTVWRADGKSVLFMVLE